MTHRPAPGPAPDAADQTAPTTASAQNEAGPRRRRNLAVARREAVRLAKAKAEVQRQADIAEEALPDDAVEADAKGAPPAEARQAETRTETRAAGARRRSAPPVAAPARPRRRHWIMLASFLAMVVLPGVVAGWYLYTRAADQYASIMAFSVRSEDTRSALDVFGALGGLGGSASADADILFQFVQSQELVARIDARLDLRALFARHHDVDPVFGFRPGGAIEDLVQHWNRKLRIAHDTGTGLMEIRVLAFDPDEAQTIARAILEESTQRINELSAIAREDATRYAREELELALERLRRAREAVTAFRIRTQIVDPSADIQGQMGLLNNLQSQLATALIDLDLLRETTREGDPRITQAERRIDVIRARIAEERARFGGGEGPAGEDFATVMAEFERLNVDREFAEQAYKSALSAHDAAMAEAQRTSRYLATHVVPTRAETARYPEREKLLGLTMLFLLLVWASGLLVYYSVRDSR